MPTPLTLMRRSVPLQVTTIRVKSAIVPRGLQPCNRRSSVQTCGNVVTRNLAVKQCCSDSCPFRQGQRNLVGFLWRKSAFMRLQKRIAERIQQEHITHNYEMAYEHNPEVTPLAAPTCLPFTICVPWCLLRHDQRPRS